MIKMSFGEFEGDSWEDLCQRCFYMKYEDEGYTRIPAEYKGDLGIEGYTKDGIVFQCYCPDADYTADDMYTHMRKKITNDLKRLIETKDLLVEKYICMSIRKWCFVVPYFNNRMLIEHCNKKKKQILKQKHTGISEDFDIQILEAKAFMKQIDHLVHNNDSYQLNYTVKYEGNRDWSFCKSFLVKNIYKKIQVLMPDNKEVIDKVVGIYMEFYLRGYEALNKLQERHPDSYEKLMRIKNNHEKNVEIECLLNNPDTISNKDLFEKITNQFSQKLTNEFSVPFSPEMIDALKNQIVSSWLLECPMSFK
ncbi:hypothetical protein HZI73_10740 [Vallitalea pronyensis]|uniref:Uncharacterized protein n=1 Tax=Vallitalea pronyensis TaxID=1348613 RepID=A0A8J8SGU7_9FIRM|nr:hypothetical protein [Vallitalea pronyensis]QUI22737.1 hypothetical protein HZI73_10740 [Vallitalea pronyensis]